MRQYSGSQASRCITLNIAQSKSSPPQQVSG